MAKFCLRTVPIVADSAVFEVCGFLPDSFKFALVNPMFARLYPSAEMWPSGRRRSPAKGVGSEGSRGFESLRLRHFTFLLNLDGPL